MTGVRPRYLPLPLAFPELNVRTYVKTPGRSGVWFFSLDAASWIAVRAARAWYGLPYYDARISVQMEGDAVRYHSARSLAAHNSCLFARRLSTVFSVEICLLGFLLIPGIGHGIHTGGDPRADRLFEVAAPAEFSASYRPTAPAYRAAPGMLDHWLTERYCLYAAGNRDRIFYGDIHHEMWSLQPTEVELRVNTMTRQIGIELPATKPITHFALYQGVVA